MNEFQLYKTCINNDVDLNYGKLSLADLRHYNLRTRKFCYQIYCDDYRFKFYKLYTVDELDDAVKQFIEIKKKIAPRAR